MPDPLEQLIERGPAALETASVTDAWTGGGCQAPPPPRRPYGGLEVTRSYPLAGCHDTIVTKTGPR
jgi:hypothetical protein